MTSNLTIGLFWQNFGPYHLARYQGCVDNLPDVRVVPVQIADATSTYDWQTDRRFKDALVTLFPGEVAERVSAWRVYRQLCRVIAEREIDVLFVPSYWPASSMAALVAARRMGIRAVMMNESHFNSGRNTGLFLILKGAVVNRFDAALVGGSVHRAFFHQLGMPQSRIFEGYDIVDNPYFARRADEARAGAARCREQLRLPERYILSLGRFVKKKNLGLLVEAYAQFVQTGRHGNHELVFVGSGPEKADLEELCRRCGLMVWDAAESDAAPEPTTAGRARFFPFAQIAEVPAYYALAACFVLPSNVEEWGLVVNEAMACGCPVLVSTMVGCAPDLVIPRVTGYGFDPAESGDLVRNLERVCGDEGHARELGKAARVHIQNWSPHYFAQQAMRAATLAMETEPRNRLAMRHPVPHIRFLQTCFPDYRKLVFEEVEDRFPRQFNLVCGDRYFTDDIKQCMEFKPWRLRVTNRFIFGRSLLWQQGALGYMCEADLAVVELNPRVLSSWLILLTRRLTGAPTLIWGHVWSRAGKNAWANIWRLTMLRLSDGIVPYSRSQARELRVFFPRATIIAAPNSLIPRSQCRIEKRAGGRATDILYVGRLTAAKKPGFLLHAFIRALDRLPPEVRLVFVGAGGERPMLVQMISDHGLESRVILRGHINDADAIGACYDNAFCAVSPGYVGLSAVQSLSQGVPMLVADREPHAPEVETLVEGVTARFFKAGDVDDFADKLVEMWRDSSDWRARRSELAKCIWNDYSVETMVDGFQHAIEQVAKRKGRAA